MRRRAGYPPPVHRLILSALLVSAWATAAPAQTPAPTPGRTADPAAAGGCAPPVLLDPGHWAAAAARRVAAAGGPEPGTPATGSLPLSATRRALATAATDTTLAPAAREAARRYLARLAMEHPHTTAAGADGCGRGVDARLELGYGDARGLHRPGIGYERETDWSGALPVPTVESPAGGAAITAATGALGLALRVRGDREGATVHDLHVAAELSDVVLWAGRRAIRYGPGGAGGVVMGGEASITGVGAVVTDPLHLPWILGYLGPVGMESFFSRARGGEVVVDPWLWGARLTASPHPRFRIGASRGTLFGGEGNTPVTVRHALQMLLGMHSGIAGEFDNHFGSVDLRYRPPWVPLDLYLEWGMNDSAGAWWTMPARLVGVRAPALPFAPGAGVGVEFVHFPSECCGNPMWYRNWAIRMGWTHDGVVLGHPLGGHGTEWALLADAVTADGAVVLGGRAFRRHRGEENLFWPQWGGVSAGVEATLHWQWPGGAGAVVEGYLERGGDWHASRLFAGLTWRFGG